jgi:hypothetical protein
MNIREAKAIIAKAEHEYQQKLASEVKTAFDWPKSLDDVSKSFSGLSMPMKALVGGVGGAGLGAGASLLGSEFVGSPAEDDPEMAALKNKRRRLGALLAGAGVGGLGGAAVGGLGGLEALMNPKPEEGETQTPGGWEAVKNDWNKLMYGDKSKGGDGGLVGGVAGMGTTGIGGAATAGAGAATMLGSTSRASRIGNWLKSLVGLENAHLPIKDPAIAPGAIWTKDFSPANKEYEKFIDHAAKKLAPKGGIQNTSAAHQLFTDSNGVSNLGARKQMARQLRSGRLRTGGKLGGRIALLLGSGAVAYDAYK